jgi:hypothetical protein
MQRWVKWLLDASGAGVVGAAAWALVTTAAPTLYALLKGFRGPWIYVGLGATGGISLVLVLATVIAILKRARAKAEARRAVSLTVVGKKGWLDNRIEWQEAQRGYLEKLGDLTVEIGNLGAVFTKGTKRLKIISLTSSAENLAQKIHSFSKKVAARLDKRSGKLALTLVELQPIADHLIQSQMADMTFTIAHLKPGEKDLAPLRNSIAGFRESNKTALKHNLEFRETIARTEQPTSELDASATRLVSVFDGIAEVFKAMDRHCEQMLTAIDKAMR